MKRSTVYPSLLTGVILYLAVVPGPAYAQATCDDALTTASQFYDDARFDEAIGLLNRCLERGAFSEAEQLHAYTLLSMLCFANREEADARQAMRVLLSLQPDFQPDPIQAQPSYRALVEDVRREMAAVQPAASTVPVAAAESKRPRRRGLKKWLYLGGGAVLSGAAFLLISSTGQSNRGGGGGGGGNPPSPPPR